MIENVHHQVKEALSKFGPRVVTGKLTVIGAVYDLTDAFGKGAGRIGIVDVNGNSEPNRLLAFVAAVQESKKQAPVASDDEPKEFAMPDLSLAGGAEPENPKLPKDDVQAAVGAMPGVVTRESAHSGQ